MQASLSVDAIQTLAKGVGVYPSWLHELQTADVQGYRGRRLQPTEIQLLYTSHISRHSTPQHLIKDLSSEWVSVSSNMPIHTCQYAQTLQTAHGVQTQACRLAILFHACSVCSVCCEGRCGWRQWRLLRRCRGYWGIIFSYTNIFPRFSRQSLGCVLHKCAYYIQIFTVRIYSTETYFGNTKTK